MIMQNMMNMGLVPGADQNEWIRRMTQSGYDIGPMLPPGFGIESAAADLYGAQGGPPMSLYGGSMPGGTGWDGVNNKLAWLVAQKRGRQVNPGPGSSTFGDKSGRQVNPGPGGSLLDSVFGGKSGRQVNPGPSLPMGHPGLGSAGDIERKAFGRGGSGAGPLNLWSRLSAVFQ